MTHMLTVGTRYTNNGETTKVKACNNGCGWIINRRQERAALRRLRAIGGDSLVIDREQAIADGLGDYDLSILYVY